MPNKIKIEVTEAELHALTWGLVHMSSDSHFEMTRYGRPYGVIDATARDLYNRLMDEWDQWAKKPEGL